MYSVSLKFSFYFCRKFPGKAQALSFIGHLHLIVQDLFRCFPKMKGYDQKEGRENEFYQGRERFRIGRCPWVQFCYRGHCVVKQTLAKL